MVARLGTLGVGESAFPDLLKTANCLEDLLAKLVVRVVKGCPYVSKDFALS